VTTTKEPATSTDAAPPPLTPLELARWAWRQLTSMRVALLLLFLLAVAAVPGSLVPQQGVDPVKVAEFRRENPGLAEFYDRLSLFDVFASPWFSAIYLLLVISLVGCVVPRSRQHWRAARARPPAAPRNLGRLPEHREWETDAAADDVLAEAAKALRARRFRVDVRDGTVRAEKGYLRETGNLVFHLSLLVVLIGVAVGHLFGFKGSALIVEGEGFANTLTQYDNFSPGPYYDSDRLAPFSLRLEDFSATYEESGQQRGSARSFAAKVSYREEPEAAERTYDLRVNHPLRVGGTKLFLTGHGYAALVQVRDGEGNVVLDGPVPFLPQDPVGFGSVGVVKAADAVPEQLGFSGFFLPTAVIDPERGPMSLFPAPRNPGLVLTAWKGDLGLDSGLPQSVYQLDTERLTQLKEGDEPVRAHLGVGQTMTLPGGVGSLKFTGYREWVVLQIAHDPGKELALGGAALALLGLLASLFVRPRRMWVRARAADGGRTVVEIGALARVVAPGLGEEIEHVAEALRGSSLSELASEPMGGAARANAADERSEEGG
jgi:cytochrome c biogenesis protein